MRNPYEVLGIREGASIEEIKKAYKELVKKYHPDQYQNNPLSDLAESKLKEINQAYDALMKQSEGSGGYSNRSGSSQTNYSRNGNSSSYGGNNGDIYNQARMHINSGNIMAAEGILNRVKVRDAEWHYLTGLIFARKGWYNEAYNNLMTATNMDPSNFEYRSALNQMNNTNYQYQSNVFGRRGYNNGGMDMCQMCQCMICTDCLCDSMGGDCC